MAHVDETVSRIASPRGHLRAWMLALVAVVSLAVYANSVPNGFALDDVGIIEFNPSVQNLEWTKIWVENYWPSPEGPPDVLYRPLTICTYLMNQALAPGKTWPFHAVNVVLHAVVSVLVTLLAWRLLRHAGAAVAAGVLFAVHPIHTEVVANVVGRAEILAALWTLAGILVMLPSGDLLAEPSEKRRWWHGWLVSACFLLALLSKETPAAMIGGIVLIDVWRWSHWPRDRRPTLVRWLGSQTARYYVPLAVAVGVYVALRVNAVGLMADTRSIHPVVNPLVEAALPERLVTPLLLLSKYISLTLWPARLSSDYSAPSLLPTANLAHPQVLMGLLLVAAGALAVLGRWRRWPGAAICVLLFVASYVLVSNYLRIGTIFAERLFYFPSAFVLMLAGLALGRGWDAVAALPTRRAVRTAGGLAAGAACVALSVRTYVRNPDWQDNIHLAIATACDNPGSAKACFWAGSVLVTQKDKPEWVETGISLMKDAVRLRGDYGAAHYELARHYGRENQFAESFIWLCQAARWRSGQYEVHTALRAVRDDLKKQPAESYMPAVQKFYDQNRGDASAYLAMGLALAANGKIEEADAVFAEGVKLDGNFHEFLAQYGMLKFDRKEYEAAAAWLKGYCLRVRGNPAARVALARAFMALDAEAYPHAMREADHNLTRAAAMFFADSSVREARREWALRMKEIEARGGPAGGGGASSGGPGSGKSSAAQVVARDVR